MTEAPLQRKKGGRPRRHAPDAKRPTMAFRMGSELHAKLVAASIAHERSLSEEIERRVENSFEVARHEAVTAAMLGGGKMAALLKDVIAASNLIRAPEISNTYELQRRAFIRAVRRVAERHLPDQVPLMPLVQRTAEWQQACGEADKLGDEIADLVLRQSLEALMDRLQVARLQGLETVRDREQEDDLAAFAGSAGLMGRWATEAKQVTETAAKPSPAPKANKSKN